MERIELGCEYSGGRASIVDVHTHIHYAEDGRFDTLDTMRMVYYRWNERERQSRIEVIVPNQSEHYHLQHV